MSSYNTSKFTSLTQSFKVITPTGVPGMFVSKIELFLKAKSDSLGLQLFVSRQTGGLPDLTKIVPGSLVTVDPEDISTSTDGTVGTSFTFSKLLYLESGESYNFTVKPVGSSPDYEIWVGELGGRDLSTDKPIGSNPLVENAYYSGNNERWAELVNQDVKFKLYRAKFNKNIGTASLRNKSAEILKMYNLSLINGLNVLTPGTKVFGWANGYVNSAIYGTVSSHDATNNVLFLKNSSGNFQGNTDIAFVQTGVSENNPSSNSSGLLGVGRIESNTNLGLYSFFVHALAPKLGIKDIQSTKTTLDYIGAVYNGTKFVQGPSKTVTNGQETEFVDRPRFLLGKTNEESVINEFRTGRPSTNSSLIIKATLEAENDFVSPVIDLEDNDVVILRNIINNDTTDEHTNTGAAKARYISKTITLEDGMEAEDLRVYITANKPAKTELHVYAKIWADGDPQRFEDKVWSKLTYEVPGAVRNTNKPDEYLEYVYSFAANSTLAGNVFAAYQTDNSTPVAYLSANSTGGTVGGELWGGTGGDKFKKFAIKIVMTAEPGYGYLAPKVNDLRVIALQV